MDEEPIMSEMTCDERKLHQLIALIEAQPEGFKVGYGDAGQVTLKRRFFNPAEPIAAKSIP